jgi:hypothetical protein
MHDDRLRVLWSEVVLAASADIVSEPYGSIDFTDAEAFFTAGGSWAESRETIAAFLELHVDDLTRLGRRVLAERWAREVPPPLKPLVHMRRKAPVVEPVKVKPKVPFPCPKPVKPPREPRDRDFWIARFLARQSVSAVTK